MAEHTLDTATRAKRRYRRDMIIASVLYVGAVFAGALAIRTFAPPQWALIVLALLPLAPALLMLRAFIVFLGEIDEFQRRIQTEAVLISAAVVGFSSFAYSFLEEWADFPRVSLIWVFPALIGVWGLAACVVRWRYK